MMTGKKSFATTRMSLFFVVALSLFRLDNILPAVYAEEGTCDWSSACESTEPDPALKEFTYNVGDGPQTMLAYVEPELLSFYQKPGEEPPKRKYRKLPPKFDGFAAKFINMSNKQLNFYWESAEGGEAYFMATYEPFASDGTGSFPTHRFFFSTPEEPDVKLNLWILGEYPENIYVYDPYEVENDPEQTETNLAINLDDDEREQYDLWKKTLLFNDQYKAFTGRSYLANYGEDGPRAKPMHFMWRADYFGQQHWVTTRETHFVKMPPSEDLHRVPEYGIQRVLKDSDPPKFQEYRALDEITQKPLTYMNMTMTVLSCAPRVFEIKNFLSPEEVEHVLELATGISLNKSRTGNSGDSDSSSDTRTRTSRNSWIQREKSPIVDTIYRRAADLTRIDEALLRQRSDSELPELELGHTNTLAETLQLVHYDVAQEYTAHHDFGYSHIEEEDQSARFATILFYLNDDMDGGETAFPRWINGHSFDGLRVKPELGKAILFYDQLPDGNFDDFSQHAAKPIIEGEKWLINLWIWDPVYN